VWKLPSPKALSQPGTRKCSFASPTHALSLSHRQNVFRNHALFVEQVLPLARVFQPRATFSTTTTKEGQQLAARRIVSNGLSRGDVFYARQ